MRELVVQPRLQIGDLRGDRRKLRRFLRVLARELVALLRDLRAATIGGFRGLPQGDELELEIVTAPLLRCERQAFAMPRCLRGPADRARRCRARSARRFVACARRVDEADELGQFALARQDTVQLAVGREQQHRLVR